MAKITTITNPLTGQPAQVDQLDHTAQQIDDGLNIARGVSNPNLLDNWYFVNPVNQRGVTSGKTTPNVYFIDRWLTIYGSSGAGTYSLGTDGITLTPYANDSCSMFQRFENIDELDGKVLTASVLLSNGELFSGTITRVNGTLQWFYLKGNKISLYMNSNNTFSIGVYINPLTIKGAKLELGDQQTLAHQDANGNWVLNELPNYADTLARCQRYFQKIGVSSGKYNIIGVRSDNANCGCPVVFNEMRATPVVTLPDSSACDIWYNMVSNAVSSVSYEQINNRSMWLKFASTVVTSGNSCVMRISSGNYIQLSADL